MVNREDHPYKKLEIYNKILIIEPHNLSALIQRSLLLIRFGQYDKALQDANKLIQMGDKDEVGLYRKGHALLGIN